MSRMSRKPTVHRVGSGVHAQRAPMNLRLLTTRYPPVRKPLNLNLGAQQGVTRRQRRKEDWDDWITIRCASPEPLPELSVWIPADGYDKATDSTYSSAVYSGVSPSETYFASEVGDGERPSISDVPRHIPRSPASCGVESCSECYAARDMSPASSAIPSPVTASPVVIDDDGIRDVPRRHPRPLASFATHHSNGSDASADIGLALRMPLASAPAVITTFPLSSPTASEFSICQGWAQPASLPATPQGGKCATTTRAPPPTRTFPCPPSPSRKLQSDADGLCVDTSRRATMYALPPVHSPLGTTSFSFVDDLEAGSLPHTPDACAEDDDTTLPIIDEHGERSCDDTDDDDNDDLELNTPRRGLDLSAARDGEAVDVGFDGTATLGRGRMGRAIKSIQSFGSLRTARSLTSLRSRLGPRKPGAGAPDDAVVDATPHVDSAPASRRSFSFLRRQPSQLWRHASQQDAAEEGERALREHLEKNSQRRDRRLSALRLRGFM